MATIEKVIPFNKIKLQDKEEIKFAPIKYGDTLIELRNPTSKEIYDLIMVTLQKADEGDIYNPYLLDIYFHLNLFYTYAKITFSAEDRADELDLYDKLSNSGLLQMLIDAIPANHYNTEMKMIEEIAEKKSTYRGTTASLIQSLINDLPRQAEAAMDIVNNFDPEKWKAVQDFAKAANGGRDITMTSNSDKTE